MPFAQTTPAPPRFPLGALFCLALFLQTAAAAQAAGPLFIFTADTEGRTGPCDTCSEETAAGGLARRLTVLEAARSGKRSVLAADAGDAMFGKDSLPSGGRVIVKAYGLLGYDAVNVSWRDFRLGRAHTLKLLKDAAFTPISANLLDASTGKLLFQPYAIKKAGGRRIGIVGITAAPPSLEHLPRLAAELEGIRVRPPLEALVEHLGALEKKADDIVLLYHGPARRLREVLRGTGKRFRLVCAGGLGAAGAVLAGRPGVVVPLSRGRGVSAASLPAAGAAPKVSRFVLGSDILPSPPMEALLQEFTPAADAPQPGSSPPDRHGENRGLRVDVLSHELRDDPQGAELVIHTRWTNQMPLDIAFGLDLGEGGAIADLRRQAFLLVDDRIVVRMAPGGAAADGRLPDRFSLARIGDAREGDVVFRLPSAKPRTADLVVTSQTFAPIRIPVLDAPPPGEGASGNAQAPTAPLAVKRNEVAEVAFFGFEKRERLGDLSAPPGNVLVVCDIRGRSLLSKETPARALDARADAKSKARLPILMEYLKAAVLLEIVADGEYASPRVAGAGSLDPEPPFLPGHLAGGEVVFIVPDDARSLELVLQFPEMALTTGPELGFPGTIRFALEKPKEPEKSRPAVVEVQDAQVPLSVLGHDVLEGLGAFQAPAGKRLLALEVAVTNRSTEGGLFIAGKRFHCSAGGAPAVEPSAVTGRGGAALAEPFWLPPGERRAFKVLFEIPESARGAHVAYSGVTKAASFDLSFDGKTARLQRDVAAAPGGVPATSAAPPPEAAAAGPTAAPAAVALEAKGLAGVGLTAKDVNAAIDRGREFLWKQVQAECEGNLDRFPANKTHTIAALALVHCGAQERYREFDRVLRAWIRGSPKERRVGIWPKQARRATYAASIFCMVVDAYGDPFFFPELRQMARTLVEGQIAEGSWTYTLPAPEGLDGAPPASSLLTVIGKGPEKKAIERLTEWKEGRGDNSATQFALLGLRAARRRNIGVPAETWKRAQNLYSKRQEDDGGWAYVRGSSYGSMTCAGACSVLLARWALGEARPERSASIERGIDWLATNFETSANPRSGRHNHYYLYSLERVGRLFATEFIGKNEWYPLGVKTLLARQLDDGGWKENRERVVPTSFALLFLTRATEALVEETKSGPGTLRTLLQTTAAPRYYIILDASGSMLASLGGRVKFEIARAALLRLIGGLPNTASVALRAYGHRKSSIEKGAERDTELVAPMKPLEKQHRQAILGKLKGLTARGKTPLGLSLQETTRDLQKLRSDARTTVVLLSDGGDDTGSGIDPFLAAEKLGRLRNVTLIVVGFDVADEPGKAQLRGIAAGAGGAHLTAAEAESLSRSLRAAVGQVDQTFVVEDADGAVVATGRFGDSLKLKPGSYRLVASPYGIRRQSAFQVKPSATVSIVCNAQVQDDLREKAAAPARTPAAAPAPAGAPKFCTQCGSRLGPGARFCTQCGAKAR